MKHPYDFSNAVIGKYHKLFRDCDFVWVHKVNARSGRLVKSTPVKFISGDEEWSTVQLIDGTQRAVRTAELFMKKD